MTRARLELETAGFGEKLNQIDADVEREIEEAVRFAEESPEPGPELLEASTYAGPFAR